MVFFRIVLPLQCKLYFTKTTMSNGVIKHRGVIERINTPHIQVRIEQSSACAGCKVAHNCNAAESKEKIIDVYTYSRDYQVGQQVVVSTSNATATYSTLIGFGLPLILLLGILLTMKIVGLADEEAALSAIGSLVPYYFVVWILRHKIAKRIVFKVENNNN